MTPGTVPSDGLAPETFYTYQIVFVPDMTQKYGLKIKGGAGEFRAAMNLVNGWQYTGLGPFYMKDSSSAQNIMASGITANLAGQGVADVVNSVADLAGSLQSGETTDSSNPQVQRVSEKIGALPLSIQPMVLDNFAEIHVYEPNVTPDGMMVWSEIVCLSFDRHVLGTKECDITTTSAPAAASQQTKNVTRAGGLQTGESALGRAVVANALGIPLDSPALQELSAGGLQSGETGASVPSIMNQVQVGCGEECKPSKTVNLFNFGKHHENPRRPRIETRRVIGPSSNLFALPQGSGGATESGGSAGPQGEGGLNSDEISDGFSTMPPVNQPIINQPIMDGDALRKLLIPEPKNDQNAGNTDAPEEIPELDLRPQ